jgi:hypothetical protein
MLIHLPRSAPGGRGEPTYAQLILRLRRSEFIDGPFFRTGARVEETALWPSPAYPEVPLLLEFAGRDRGEGRNARGHNRAPDIHLLWRYDRARREFDEIASARSYGAEWFHHLAPIIRRHIIRPPANHAEAEKAARGASARVLAALEGELDQLEDEGRDSAIALLYDQVAARFAASVAESAAGFRQSTRRARAA